MQDCLHLPKSRSSPVISGAREDAERDSCRLETRAVWIGFSQIMNPSTGDRRVFRFVASASSGKGFRNLELCHQAFGIIFRFQSFRLRSVGFWVGRFTKKEPKYLHGRYLPKSYYKFLIKKPRLIPCTDLGSLPKTLNPQPQTALLEDLGFAASRLDTRNLLGEILKLKESTWLLPQTYP